MTGAAPLAFAIEGVGKTYPTRSGDEVLALADVTFDVADNERMHEILSNLPLFPYMQIKVTPLATHPSDVALL